MSLPLLELSERVEKPRKRVRAVSRAQYAELRDSGRLTDGQAAVLRELAAYYNRRQEWPTVHELARWMFDRGDIIREASNLIAPRLHELEQGVKNRKTGVAVGGAVIETLPARPCKVAGTKAHPYRIREAGSQFLVRQ